MILDTCFPGPLAPVSAQYLHYQALRQCDFSPADAQRRVAQEYSSPTVERLPPIERLARPMLVTATASVVAMVTVIAYELIFYFFN